MLNHKLILVVLAAAACAFFSGCANAPSEKGDDEQLINSLQRMGATITQLENKVLVLESRNDYLAAENEDLRFYKQQLEDIDNAIAARFKAAVPKLETSGIETGPGWIRLPEQLMFDPGDAALKAEGKKILEKLADEFKKGDFFVSIEGHTDKDPITKSKSKWPTGSNFELGSYRALNVLLFLRSKGVSSSKMRVVSWGEFKPIAANDTPKNKERNRRVEILYSKTAPTTPEEKPLLAPKEEEQPKEEPKETPPEQPKDEKPSSENSLK